MIEDIINWLVHSALGLPQEPVAEALEFFVYDTIKIILLLYFMIWIIAILRTYIPRQKVKAWLSKGRFGSTYVIAALLGSVTPFCSCSSIPIFISFIETGVPLGAAFSFLVTSPLINEYLAVLMLGFFGIRTTVAYIIAGLLLGVLAGVVVDRFNLRTYIVEDMMPGAVDYDATAFKSFAERVRYGRGEASGMVRKLWVWVMLGVGIGAFIHGFIPEELIRGAIGRAGVFSVPIAVLMGIPIYANCSAVVPIAVVLFEKGVPLGTALAFMMATAALSLPEAVILRRVMKLPLILIFFGMVAAGIVIIGYAFNIIGAFASGVGV